MNLPAAQKVPKFLFQRHVGSLDKLASNNHFQKIRLIGLFQTSLMHVFILSNLGNFNPFRSLLD